MWGQNSTARLAKDINPIAGGQSHARDGGVPGREPDCVGRQDDVKANEEAELDTRQQDGIERHQCAEVTRPSMLPSPAPREREGPNPQGWEGEGRAAEPVHPTLKAPSPSSLSLATLSRGAGEELTDGTECRNRNTTA